MTLQNRFPCNLLRRSIVQTFGQITRATIYMACLIALAAVQPNPCKAEPSAIERAETAVKQIQNGNLQGAAVTLRQGLDAEPSDTLLHNLAAALLMMTGDVSGASSEWQVCLADAPDDGLAHYGLAITHLLHKDSRRAQEQIAAAKQFGEAGHCVVAERYIEWLGGAVGSGIGLALPDSLMAASHSFNGLAAEGKGDYTTALAELNAAINSLPGDPYSETPGVIMTFDPGAPIAFGAKPLPRGNGLAASWSAREAPRSGTVVISARDVAGDAGFVMFKVDGGIGSIANRPPYELQWDTAKFPNGLHRIEILAFDKQGRQFNQAIKEIRTANAGAPRRNADNQRVDAVRFALWQFLILRPSRAYLAYAAAHCANRLGKAPEAIRLFRQSAAVSPHYKDARVQLAALEGSLSETALWRGVPTEKVVALTFDDGPKPGITDQLLAILAKERVPATFFVIGRHATAYPELTRKIAEAGMQVENHTYTHPNLTLLPANEVERELLGTIAAIQSATGKRSRFYRPPGGNMNAEVSRIASQWGLTPCMWTIDGEALENGSPNRLIAYVVQKAAPGAIVLLHNGRMTTIEALPKIIEGLRKRGFQFVTVDRLVPQKDAAQSAARSQ